ncbi:MAG TPA: sugar phosphate nucleotidyltransferase [Candidatus Saccharimonadia bacterium]|nr:sugar phosphate nucleotidyltransferase [Candidatus Saccharimonadia bacterium]
MTSPKPVTTAVILASGYGTRMLPITAGVQKELLPILNRPVIDYVVQDCLRAGIKRVIFVVRPGTHALQDYYLGSEALQRHLEHFGKQEALAELRQLHQAASFEFVEQPSDAGYGTGVPPRLVRPLLAADEGIIMCGGDDFVWHADGRSEVAAMLALLAEQPNAAGVISCLAKPVDQLHKYGVIKPRTEAGREVLDGFVEKPATGQAPSNLVNISKYVMMPAMLNHIDQLKPDTKSGEYFVTDAVLACAQEQTVLIHQATGQFLDAGSLAGWLQANLVVARQDEALAAIIRENSK